MKIYLILILEFIVIFITFFLLSFYYQINTIFYGNFNIFFITFNIIIIYIFISFIILISFQRNILDIILFIFFIFCIIISLSLLSKYIDKKIILGFLIIIISYAISIEIYLIFSCSNKRYNIIFAFISFITIVLTIYVIYLFWIKAFNDIIYLPIFGLILFLLNNISHFLLFDFYTFDNAFFKVMIMNLSILALIHRYYKYILSTFETFQDDYNHKIKKYLCLLNLYLFIQYIIIFIFVLSFCNFSREVIESIFINITYSLLGFGFPFVLFNLSYIKCVYEKQISFYINFFATY